MNQETRYAEYVKVTLGISAGVPPADRPSLQSTLRRVPTRHEGVGKSVECCIPYSGVPPCPFRWLSKRHGPR